MNKKIILFDIDFTLFDAKSYRDTFIDMIEKSIKYKGDDFSSLADMAYKISKQKIGYFDTEVFIEELSKLVSIKLSREHLQQIILNQELISHSLYPDVLPVLKTISRQKGIIAGIFSQGKRTIQRPKIRLLEYLLDEHNIHIFEFYKIHAFSEMLRLYKGFHLYLVDDILEILQKAKDIAANMTTIWIKRDGYSRVSSTKDSNIANFSPEYIINSLKEVIPIIEKT